MRQPPSASLYGPRGGCGVVVALAASGREIRRREMKTLALLASAALLAGCAYAAQPETISGISWNPMWSQNPAPACIAKALDRLPYPPASTADTAMMKANGHTPIVGVGPMSYSISPDGKTQTCTGSILVLNQSGVGATVQPGQLVVSAYLKPTGGFDNSRYEIQWLRLDPEAPIPSTQDAVIVSIAVNGCPSGFTKAASGACWMPPPRPVFHNELEYQAACSWQSLGDPKGEYYALWLRGCFN